MKSIKFGAAGSILARTYVMFHVEQYPDREGDQVTKKQNTCWPVGRRSLQRCVNVEESCAKKALTSLDS